MQRLIEHFRLPEELIKLSWNRNIPSPEGFFRLGEGITCFGSYEANENTREGGGALCAVSQGVYGNDDVCRLPFDPDRVVDNLLLESYPQLPAESAITRTMREAYYVARPLLPAAIRRHFQRLYLSGWDGIAFPSWPVDCTVERIYEQCLALSMKAQGLTKVPFVWFWPEGHESCAIVTHDVEATAGRDFCPALMDIDDSFGIKSSFQVIPEERYTIPIEYLNQIRDRGFEVNVHDVKHDGTLFASERNFLEQAAALNRYGREFGAVGFRAGVMYRNQRWFNALEFEYDMSVPNVAHLDPQRGGCCCIHPYFIGKLVELPLTTSQDYTLFHYLRQYSLDLWRQQIELIRRNHGLISILVHPDYIIQEKEQNVYRQLLRYVANLREENNVWVAKPKEVNNWWRHRNSLVVVRDGAEWRIEGEGRKHARLAFACLDGDEIKYEIQAGDSAPAQPETRQMTDISTGIPDCANLRPSRLSPVVTDADRTVSLRKNGGLDLGEGAHDRIPLRVCMVAYTKYESDNRVMRYAETLASRGDHVDVIALRRLRHEPDLVINGVNVLKVQVRERNERGKIEYLSRLLAFLLRSALILNKRHRQLPYDIIHIHSVPDFLVFAAWLPKLRGAKIILDIHDVLPELYASKFSVGQRSWVFKALLWVERISARAAHHVIIANDLWWERLVTRSVSETKCTSILNFPDEKIFHRTASASNDGRFIMLYPGSLNWHQGLDLAIRALARIHNDVPNAELHIYGGGPEKEKLKLLVHSLCLDDKVFLHGSLPIREIVKVMQNADLGIVPKRGDSFGNEAFSTKTLEFMALGVPLIVADTAIDRYYFNDSLVKFFRSGDEENLAAAMLQMINDSKLRQELARNGREFARRNGWESHRQTYLDIVDALVCKGAAKDIKQTESVSAC